MYAPGLPTKPNIPDIDRRLLEAARFALRFLKQNEHQFPKTWLGYSGCRREIEKLETAILAAELIPVPSEEHQATQP